MKRATLIVIVISFLTWIFAAVDTGAGENVPKVVLMGSLSKVYEPVRLDHAEHISMIGGCEECHHQHRSMMVQSCSECHRFDPSVFRKNVDAGTLKPCGACHAVTNPPGDRARLELKAAYHQACFKCHKEEVAGSPKGCTGMCHTPKAEGKREGSK